MKARGKFLVDSVEAAVGENGNDIAGFNTVDDICNNGVSILEQGGVFSGHL